MKKLDILIISIYGAIVFCVIRKIIAKKRRKYTTVRRKILV